MGALKTAMRHIISPRLLTEEELQTLVAWAQEFVNRRPLSFISGDAKDMLPLTPNSFLRAGEELPNYGEHMEEATKYLRRWKHVEETTIKLWKRFVKEVLPQHQAWQKWRGQSRDIKEGDVVLYVGEDRKAAWPLAVVEAKVEGRDGHVREVDLRLAGDKKVKRVSLHRLALLVPVERATGH